MASNLGSTPIEVEFTYAGTGTRAIWYARYIGACNLRFTIESYR